MRNLSRNYWMVASSYAFKLINYNYKIKISELICLLALLKAKVIFFQNCSNQILLPIWFLILTSINGHYKYSCVFITTTLASFDLLDTHLCLSRALMVNKHYPCCFPFVICVSLVF